MRGLGSWDDVRFFLAVARGGTLASAARALGVTPSTVLRRVDQLEETLGTRLFDRGRRGYALTGPAEQLVELAARIEDDVLAFDRAVSGADLALRGTLRVTTVGEILALIAPHLRRFRDLYPAIDFEVNTEVRRLSLTRREADVAIRPGAAPDEPDVIGKRLVALPTAAYASPAYLADSGRPRRRTELRKHCLIGFDADSERSEHRRWVRAHCPGARVGYRTNTLEGQRVAAEAGLGIALLPRFMGDRSERLERLFVVSDLWDHHLWLLVHRDLRRTARVRALVDHVSQAITADASIYSGR